MRNFYGKQILVNFWNESFNVFLKGRDILDTIIDSITVSLVSPPRVASIDTTIEKIINEKCSVSRFGDGELKLVAGKSISFQKHSSLLETRLKEVLVSNNEGHIVCIPDIFSDNSQYTESYAEYWKSHLKRFRFKWYKNLNMKQEYFNSFISRFYLCYQDRQKSERFFKKIKKIWNERDVVIIEGEFSRLGVGNDLFENTKSVKRILAPKKDAFSSYNEIVKFVTNMDKDILILIALGPTATVLSLDLHNEGFQAVDIGHIDVEYEWYLKGAKEKLAIKNKFVNEVNAGKFEEEFIESEYYDQIIYHINKYLLKRTI